MVHALLVRMKDLKDDIALQGGGRGARKILVAEAYPETERATEVVVWRPPSHVEKCPVQVTRDMEIAVVTHLAAQDRHFHKIGTEMYMVLEGEMTIEVEGEDYALSPGDMIVVNPGAVHQVKPAGTEFMCRVVIVNCGGSADKYIAEPGA